MFGLLAERLRAPAQRALAELTSGSAARLFAVSSTAVAYLGSVSFVPAGASSTSGLEP